MEKKRSIGIGVEVGGREFREGPWPRCLAFYRFLSGLHRSPSTDTWIKEEDEGDEGGSWDEPMR